MNRSFFAALLDLLTHLLSLVIGFGAARAAVAFGELIGRSQVERLAVSVVTGLVCVGLWLWVLRSYWCNTPEKGVSPNKD